MPRALRTLPPSVLDHVPGLRALADLVRRLAAFRPGGRPVGLLALLPVAVAIDVLDALDEVVPVAGSVGMLYLETAFVLALTGRPGWSAAVAAIDLLPGIDVVPFATFAVVAALRAPQALDAPVAPAKA